MKVTTRITRNIETGEITEHDFYLYAGPVDLACSSTDKAVQASDLALQSADTSALQTQTADANLAFGENQTIQNGLAAKLNYEVANPMGYTPAELASMTTNVNENTATAAKQAIGAAAAFAATHGSADIGGGGAGQLAGEIASSAALSKSSQLNDIAMQSQQMKQSNMWKGIAGLSGVGSEFGSETGTAVGGETNLSNAATGAGEGAVGASTAANSELGGLISGIGGLATAGAGFVSANPNGILGS